MNEELIKLNLEHPVKHVHQIAVHQIGTDQAHFADHTEVTLNYLHRDFNTEEMPLYELNLKNS